jgi:hypothetical protein
MHRKEFVHRVGHLLRMHFYGTALMYPYKQSVRWQDVFNLAAYAWMKYHKTASTSLPEDEHLDVRNI